MWCHFLSYFARQTSCAQCTLCMHCTALNRFKIWGRARVVVKRRKKRAYVHNVLSVGFYAHFSHGNVLPDKRVGERYFIDNWFMIGKKWINVVGVNIFIHCHWAKPDHTDFSLLFFFLRRQRNNQNEFVCFTLVVHMNARRRINSAV